ncbi:NAD+-dependent malic enzyme [Candidatus Phytoplasma pruni]|uniref:NAD+-dependent malic enzyme n=1 Tax=Candidatus Phytoplasma pruni TaxID=479893 RepID=A0A0M1N0H8_9MOLU|nr:NADP-dependent malic enzyme [Candidatus Phytoplasma pruni]KOR75540.1 NAD+-dependent malic enzyme [Candidatus Phytoplasma pruni]MDW3617928.1 NADP-dependent malic enzyme [Candidatus Phytoplasma pruni]
MDTNQKSLLLHEKHKGKLAAKIKTEVNNFDDLSLVYTPGVSEPCRKIQQNSEDLYKYTMKSNTVAVITNGTAVLGLGDIGSKASIPVMEGKSILFKRFADIDSFPIAIDSKDPEEIVNIIAKISDVFGAINLEDIKAPECFQIEEALKAKLSIPVLHDDQHGTAIVVASGLINALRVVNKKLEDIRVVICGTGSAGVAVAKMLLNLKVKDIVLYDKKGVILRDSDWTNQEQKKMSLLTNKNQEDGALSDVIKNKDVFIGVSGPNILNSEMVSTMAKDAIVFALANPNPEILPEEAKKGGARIIATGRSDYPNQVNNCLAFPGVFRGALDYKATQINEEMKVAAVYALASVIPVNELNENNIIPGVFNEQIVASISKAVGEAAVKTGAVRK